VENKENRTAEAEAHAQNDDSGIPSQAQWRFRYSGTGQKQWSAPSPKVVTWVWRQQSDFLLNITSWWCWARVSNPAELWFCFTSTAIRVVGLHVYKIVNQFLECGRQRRKERQKGSYPRRSKGGHGLKPFFCVPKDELLQKRELFRPWEGRKGMREGKERLAFHTILAPKGRKKSRDISWDQSRFCKVYSNKDSHWLLNRLGLCDVWPISGAHFRLFAPGRQVVTLRSWLQVVQTHPTPSTM